MATITNHIKKYFASQNKETSTESETNLQRTSHDDYLRHKEIEKCMRILVVEGILWDEFHPPHLNLHHIYNNRVNTPHIHKHIQTPCVSSQIPHSI